MAMLNQIVEQLEPGHVAVREQAGTRCEVSLRTYENENLWVVRYHRPDYPPHDAMAFETVDDMIGYFEAAGMVDGWEHMSHGTGAS